MSEFKSEGPLKFALDKKDQTKARYCCSFIISKIMFVVLSENIMIYSPKPVSGGTKEKPLHLQSDQLKQAKQMYDDLSGPSVTEEHNRIDNLSTKTKMFYPGKSAGQPYKRNTSKYCYKILKTSGRNIFNAGDYFDNFISQADKSINYYESLVRNDNPYNPLNLEAAFDLQIIPEDHFENAKNQARKEG
jgi:hypothetical protein